MASVRLDSHGKGWGAPSIRRPPFAGLGRARKVALLGGGTRTLRYAPWWDPTWELWAHASCRNQCARMPDVLFDLHPPELWRDPSKKHWDLTYHAWLKQNSVPIYMQEHYTDVPASIKYPFAQAIHQFRPYFTNHVAWMIALALMEGVTHIGLYGCHYESDSEYGVQRGGAEYWCGIAEGRGVQVLIPPECNLLNFPPQLYGYESHPDGKRVKEYGLYQKAQIAGKTPDAPKTELKTIDPESAEGRIPLRQLYGPEDTPIAIAWDRSGHLIHA